MRVFISSVIRGMEPYRTAVSGAVEALGLYSHPVGGIRGVDRYAPPGVLGARADGRPDHRASGRQLRRDCRVQVSRQRMKSFARLATTAR